MDRTYIAIDLKSFYASVECEARGLDPLTTHLVVADTARTKKTICLAVSPSLKRLGIPGRARLFEVNEKIRGENVKRLKKAPGNRFAGTSYSAAELEADPSLELTCITAVPRMAWYMEYSARIYQIYLKYAAPEDIHVYSIDEVFVDATAYLKARGMTAREFAMTMIRDVLRMTGITATAGIGTNLYLAKIAMDIVAKHLPADADGVRIAELDEMTYRKTLWIHRPLTDFWRVGRGIARRLEKAGLYTMGDIARCSVHSEEVLYRMLGVNAELLIDHAWGWEPCTIADIRAVRPENRSLTSGQVLQEAYPADKCRLVVSEMADSLAMQLTEKDAVTDQITLMIGYDIDNPNFHGERQEDFYGRAAPPPAHGSCRLDTPTSSARRITAAARGIFDRLIDPELLVRRLYIGASLLDPDAPQEKAPEQLSFFDDAPELDGTAERTDETREWNSQKAVLEIRKRFGKNAIVRGMDLEEGATTVLRNNQIGGHKA